jgi:hypothetical protein
MKQIIILFEAIILEHLPGLGKICHNISTDVHSLTPFNPSCGQCQKYQFS